MKQHGLLGSAAHEGAGGRAPLTRASALPVFSGRHGDQALDTVIAPLLGEGAAVRCHEAHAADPDVEDLPCRPVKRQVVLGQLRSISTLPAIMRRPRLRAASKMASTDCTWTAPSTTAVVVPLHSSSSRNVAMHEPGQQQLSGVVLHLGIRRQPGKHFRGVAGLHHPAVAHDEDPIPDRAGNEARRPGRLRWSHQPIRRMLALRSGQRSISWLNAPTFPRRPTATRNS